MKLILTHENADFDAIAAQLAAQLLEPDAVPILPRRLNDNVRDFMTLYQVALPHKSVETLSRRRIESVTVVDSQSFTSVKGMRPDTPITIIDHHPKGDDLPDHATFSGELTGATTTLLVERIRERHLSPTPVEATLLALGIYEDTGALLYGTTTPRDITAAAWTVAKGADLDVVRRFLQHPLNDDQQMLYELLLHNVAVSDVQGHPVAVAVAEVDHNIDQISTVAHKLRELLQPAALFMLVMMRGNMQIVARSTVDEINVGQITEQLGGGGHTRAAAALIEDANVDHVQQRLQTLLQKIVVPAVRVSDLMSGGIVRTVPAEMAIKDVVDEMRWSGHEGFPVVENGELVGLLTRQAVDRAIRHRMGTQPISSVMDAGHVVVHSEDSMRYVQKQMLQSGWGQIPVVDPDEHIIGIVTRTDLIKQWGQPGNGAARRKQIVQLLETALPPDQFTLLKAVSTEARALGLGLYTVGGFVRDLLLSRPNTDIDLVVEGDAIGLVRHLVKQYGGRMRKHVQFGTATWLPDAEVFVKIGLDDTGAIDHTDMLDFVSARTEFYENPTALPTVERGSIKLDLHRRDFSINTLAVRLAPEPFGQLLDYWGGERDLQLGVIRVLHSLSFVDDPTRIMRAARFAQRFDFAIDNRSLGLIERALPLLERVTGPRLRHELELIFLEYFPERVFAHLQQLGVLTVLNQHLHIDDWLTAVYATARETIANPPWDESILPMPSGREQWMLVQYALLCCRMPEDAAMQLARRLQVKRNTMNEVTAAVRSLADRLPALAQPCQPSEVAAQLDALSDIGLFVAWVAASDHARKLIDHYVTDWRQVKTILSGDDLQQMGVRPGPVYQVVLQALRNHRLDGKITTRDDEVQLAMALLHENEADNDEHR